MAVRVATDDTEALGVLLTVVETDAETLADVDTAPCSTRCAFCCSTVSSPAKTSSKSRAPEPPRVLVAVKVALRGADVREGDGVLDGVGVKVGLGASPRWNSA